MSELYFVSSAQILLPRKTSVPSVPSCQTTDSERQNAWREVCRFSQIRMRRGGYFERGVTEAS